MTDSPKINKNIEISENMLDDMDLAPIDLELSNQEQQNIQDSTKKTIASPHIGQYINNNEGINPLDSIDFQNNQVKITNPSQNIQKKLELSIDPKEPLAVES